MVKYCQRGDDVKKRFIDLVTNWKYTWLGWVVTIYFILLQARFLFGMSDAVIHTVVLVDVAVLLMSAGRWWGSIIGVLWRVVRVVEGAALEMLCTKVPRVRIPNSPPNSGG